MSGYFLKRFNSSELASELSGGGVDVPLAIGQ
jgi:hypothetical protein